VQNGVAIEATDNATLVSRLIREAWAGTVDPRASGHRTQWTDIATLIHDHGASAIVARVDGIPVGCVVAKPSNDAATVELQKLAVLHDHRGGGIAESLVQEVERFARGLRAKRIMLAVSAYQPLLVTYYARLGYVVVPEEIYASANPSSPPPIVMSLALDDAGVADPIAEATRALTNGGLVVLPTETVYGLGANASDPLALRRVFATKGRPADHPLIVHLANASQLDDWAVDIPDSARLLAATYWPGPLTMVLKRAPHVLDEVTGGRDTVGLRVPNHPTALALLGLFGGGIAAPSANRFGRVSPTTADDVRADLGAFFVDGLDVILDGGPSEVGVESTIIELLSGEPQLLRPGGLPVERIEETLGRSVRRTPTGPSRAPGMLASHYAPTAVVRVVPNDSDAIQSALMTSAGPVGAFVPASCQLPVNVMRTPAPEPFTPEGVAPLLYRTLRLADEAGLATLIVVAPDGDGLGPAVRDRLLRAAHSEPSVPPSPA
jgi:L-threonylcarbamoyladenylate synthase